ncbi:MAG: acyl-CoA/acyl-ACP dehydrogenase [Chloroflexi bacterium]|nr:acyl-CoA/acyl-ACP dehydrogenase [Chloroflexota bacterium]
MNFELTPITEPGRRFVALAEEHAADFATRADQHDRENSFPFENIEAMQKSGVMAACVPEEFGGFGVDSVHDMALGIGRLGRGDASTAIAANMHVSGSWVATRVWRAAKARDDAQLVGATEGLLRQIGAGQMVTCAPASEPGTDTRHPLTEATRVDGTYVLNGHKIFGTLSPAANLFFVTIRVPDGDGGFRESLALVPRAAPGMEIKDNWDALGMRGSGSHDITFKDCVLPEATVFEQGPWGEWNELNLEIAVAGNIGLVAAFLGIAEAARDIIVDLVKTRRKAPSNRTLAERYSIQHTIAEIEIDLAACRAMLGRSGLAADAFFGEHPRGRVDLDELHQLAKDFQCTKWFVNRKAIEIVDRTLTASGGAGYLSKSPLSRMYRDVRAGPFMQPLSPNEAFEYIGKVTLGLGPDTDG